MVVLAEKVRPTVEELQRRLEDLEKRAETYKIIADEKLNMAQEKIRSKPLEAVGIVFIGGIVLGVLIGSVLSRRS